MIPYEIIVTSASRPHLLHPTLVSLLRKVDQQPSMIQIHDDAVFPGRWRDIQDAVRSAIHDVYDKQEAPSVRLHHQDPPRRLGFAINWLLANVQTDYVLYSQDDFVTVRRLPLPRALDVMHYHDLHHVRFNKRATMAFKETWNGRWYKEERGYVHSPTEFFMDRYELDGVHGYRSFRLETLTVSDHWYFQLGLWRVGEMRRALKFWTENDGRSRRLAIDEVEGLINHYFDHVAYGGDPSSPTSRALHQKTFIWGPIGEDRFIRHIGGNKEDWAGDHPRAGAADDWDTAWREIKGYEPREGDNA